MNAETQSRRGRKTEKSLRIFSAFCSSASLSRRAGIPLLFLFVSIARAQTPATQPALDPALAPFITNSTLLVAQADPARFDIFALQQWLLNPDQPSLNSRLAQLLAGQFAAVRPDVKRWITEFQAAGGKTIYGVAFMGDPADLPGVLVVPLDSAANARAIAGMLVSGRADGADKSQNAEAVVIHNAVVFGMADQVEKLRTADPADRPTIAAGLAALNDLPFKIIFSPAPALRLAAATILPEKLPDELGGGNPAALVTALQWAGVGIAPPPQPSVRVTIQCNSNAGAQLYLSAWNAFLDNLRNDPTSRRMVLKIDDLLAALQPSVDGGMVVLGLNAQALTDTIRPQLIYALEMRRRNSDHDRSMANERMLMVGLRQYNSEHQGAFPDNLDQVAQYVGGANYLRIILTNPNDSSKTPGYVYVKPSLPMDQITDQSNYVVVYDAVDAGPDGMVGVAFADGHSDVMAKADLDAKLKSQAGATTKP